MLKWRIMWQALPLAIGLLVIKVILVQFLHYDGFLEIAELRLVITAGVFLVGFMLAGTLSDYKESEKIPGEIATKLENLEDICVTMAVKIGMDLKPIRLSILGLGKSIFEWFHQKHTDEEIQFKISEFNDIIQAIDKAGGSPPILGRLLIQTYELRKIITRTQVISNTGFLLTGYALLEMVIIIISIFLLATHFESFYTELFIVFFVELLYVYLYLLIRDIDDPFEYDDDEQIDGAGEVSLLPLHDYIHRLETRLDDPN